MLLLNTIIGPCVIIICQKKLTQWRRVTENILTKGQANNTLPDYVQEGNTICLNCYNRIITNNLLKFQQHAKEYAETNVKQRKLETDESNSILSFSKAIEMITNILHTHENKEKELILYSFDEFHIIMEAKNARLKLFFDELYLLSNLSSKNKDSQVRAKKQLLFICYFLCKIQNKFVNNAKKDLTIYLDFTSVSNTFIDTF